LLGVRLKVVPNVFMVNKGFKEYQPFTGHSPGANGPPPDRGS
jgi:hypothetical protein